MHDIESAASAMSAGLKPSRHRVVIVGCGFGGLCAARAQAADHIRSASDQGL